VLPGPVRIASARVGGRFGPSRAVGPRQDDGLGPVAVAARNGRVALAWRGTDHGQGRVAVATGPWDAALTPQFVAADPRTGPPEVTLAGGARASAFWRAGGIWVSDGP